MGKKTPFYRWGEKPTVIPSLIPHDAVLPQGAAVLPRLAAVLPLQVAVLPHVQLWPDEGLFHRARAVEPPERYYRAPLRYYRKAGNTRRRESTEVKKLLPYLLPLRRTCAKRRHGTTAHEERYYRVGRGCKKLHLPLLPLMLLRLARGHGTTVPWERYYRKGLRY